MQEADHRHRRLLGPRSGWPKHWRRRGGAAQQCEEVASPHQKLHPVLFMGLLSLGLSQTSSPPGNIIEIPPDYNETIIVHWT